MNEIDQAAEIMKENDKQFVFMSEGENNKGIEIRYRFGYQRGMTMFAVIANALMDKYVEDMGYTVHDDLRNVLERTIELNDKRPNNELFDKTIEKLRELFKANKVEQNEITQSKKENSTGNDVEDMIHALRCCSDMNCVECPRLIDEDDHYNTLCQQALMIEAALMLEEFADGTRKRNDDQIC